MKVVSSVIIALFFIGCSTSMPKVKMKVYEPLPISFKYYSNAKKVEVDTDVFESILQRLINLRTDNNICANIVNKHALSE